MRFLFTMNMPSKSGAQVHQVIGEHASRDVDEIMTYLAEHDFIVVRELYRNPDKTMRQEGAVMLNPAHIGKVKEYVG